MNLPTQVREPILPPGGIMDINNHLAAPGAPPLLRFP